MPRRAAGAHADGGERPRLGADEGQPGSTACVHALDPRLGECLEPQGAFPFTPSVAEINGLDVALDLYLNEGPENVWARHALTAKATRAGAKAMGP